LRDKTARAKILFRLQRVEFGNLMMKSSKFDIAEYLVNKLNIFMTSFYKQWNVRN